MLCAWCKIAAATAVDRELYRAAHTGKIGNIPKILDFPDFNGFGSFLVLFIGFSMVFFGFTVVLNSF